jgi:hypothetical protein
MGAAKIGGENLHPVTHNATGGYDQLRGGVIRLYLSQPSRGSSLNIFTQLELWNPELGKKAGIQGNGCLSVVVHIEPYVVRFRSGKHTDGADRRVVLLRHFSPNIAACLLLY